MNTLTDLRRTLDQHAEDVADPAAVARTTAVHHRIAEVRRRRRSAGAGALALVLLAGVAALLAPIGSNDAQPAAPVLLGMRAPATQDALGYTYRADGQGSTFSGTGTIDVAKSDEPQLFSWTTSADTRVTITLPGREKWHSDVSGFRDYVVVEPGVFGQVRFSAQRGSLGVASYRLTDAVPSGAYSKDGITFRSEVAGASLLRGIVSDRGQSELRTSFVAPHGQISMRLVCAGVPTGDRVFVSMGGHVAQIATWRSCSSAHDFDPGFGSTSYQPVPGEPGSEVPVRIWVSNDGRHSPPIPADEVQDLQVGLAVYGPSPKVRVAGRRIPAVSEFGEHTWSYAGTHRAAGGDRLALPSAAEDRVAEVGFNTQEPTMVTLRAGASVSQGRFPDGGGGMGGLWVPAGSDVHLHVTGHPLWYSVSFYRRVD